MIRAAATDSEGIGHKRLAFVHDLALERALHHHHEGQTLHHHEGTAEEVQRTTLTTCIIQPFLAEQNLSTASSTLCGSPADTANESRRSSDDRDIFRVLTLLALLQHVRQQVVLLGEFAVRSFGLCKRIGHRGLGNRETLRRQRRDFAAELRPVAANRQPSQSHQWPSKHTHARRRRRTTNPPCKRQS